ncbi:aldo/keto reductase, partial [Chryseobacterium sp. SIMBA_028]
MARGIELQAYGSLAQGRYTGAGSSGMSPAESATAGMLERLAEEKGTTPESVLLGWLMKHPAGISPVVGTTNPDRIKACADAASVA